MCLSSACASCHHLDRECADAAAGAQPRGPWWWRLRCTPGAGHGSGGSSRSLLELAREAVVVVCNQPWNHCRLCPVLCEFVHKEKGYSGGSRPPNNDAWPLRWPGLPPCTPSVVVTLDSSTISQAVSAQPILVLSPGLISEA